MLLSRVFTHLFNEFLAAFGQESKKVLGVRCGNDRILCCRDDTERIDLAEEHVVLAKHLEALSHLPLENSLAEIASSNSFFKRDVAPFLEWILLEESFKQGLLLSVILFSILELTLLSL